MANSYAELLTPAAFELTTFRALVYVFARGVRCRFTHYHLGPARLAERQPVSRQEFFALAGVRP